MAFPPSSARDNVPVAITRLIVAYFCHTATRKERDQLDEWITASDANMEVFEQCVMESLRPVQYDPDRAEEFDTTSFNHN